MAMSVGPSGDPSVTRRSTRREAVLLTILGLCVLLLGAELAVRIPYPLDLVIWSESPFMTNMVKLEHGVPLYGPPTDVNSFIYAPGLEYLTYALLRPFGVQLDIRWCRLVNVLIAFAAAAGAAAIMTRVTATLGSRSPRRAVFAGAFGIAALTLHNSFTSDVPHPDNLMQLHGVLTLLLCLIAVTSGRFAHAAAAMLIAGLGVWTKQGAALAAVGAASALLVGRRWTRAQALAILAIGGATTSVALWILLRPEWARFYLLDLPVAQGVHFDRSVQNDLTTLGTGYRVPLLLLLGPSLLRLAVAGAESRRFLAAWVCVGVFSVLPNLAALLKSMGFWNNLASFGLWMLLVVWPVLMVDVERAAAAGARRVHFALALFLVATLLPVKLPQSPAAWAYARQLEQMIHDDASAGRRVLVANGMTALLRSGFGDVPLDRSASMLELTMGSHADAGRNLGDRFRDGFYDRVYLNGNGYFGYRTVLESQYHLIMRMAAPARRAIEPPGWLSFAAGLGLFLPVAVYERNAPRASDAQQRPQ